MKAVTFFRNTIQKLRLSTTKEVKLVTHLKFRGIFLVKPKVVNQRFKNLMEINSDDSEFMFV